MAANYLPHQMAERTGIWQGDLPKGERPAGRKRPGRWSSGSGRDYDRPWPGAREALMPGLSSATDKIVNQIGNILLYQAAFNPGGGKKTQQGAMLGSRLGPPRTEGGQGSRLGLPSGPTPPEPTRIMGELLPGPKPGGSSSSPSDPFGPMPQSRTRMFNPKKPGARLDDLDRDYPVDDNITFGRRPFQPDLSPATQQPTPKRRPAGMDPRKRGTWNQV